MQTTTTATEIPKKSKLKKWIGALVVLGLIGFGVGAYYWNKKVPDTADLKPDFTIDATQLIAEFDKDETAATQKYNAKILLVKGKVVASEKTDSTCAVTIGSTENLGNVRCDFSKAHLQDGLSMKEGDEVIIKGKCNGKLLDVSMNLCIKQ
jgi:hypothetical protein